MTKTPFNWRGGQVTRLEALTDTVFGFAITLLVVSLEVPTDFDQLMGLMEQFIAFAASFAILIMVWVYHYKFFKRYDLDDGYIIFLNSLLLFVVLVYVYPLKFVFSMGWLTPWKRPEQFLSLPQLGIVFTIYGVGYIVVFAIFALLYRHAYNKREAMNLNLLEQVDAKEHIAACMVMMFVGVLSVLVALFANGPWVIAAGPIYGIIGPLQWYVGARYDKLKKAALASMTTTTENPLVKVPV
jgi:uncharacterized membrane protein